MTKGKLGFAMVSISLFMFAVQSDCESGSAQANPGAKSTVSLTISGTIKNFKDFAACANSKAAYIQLVRFNEGRVQTFYGDNGVMTIVSDLDTWGIPTKADFSFNAPKVISGDKYFLVFQETNCNSTFWDSPVNSRYSPFFMKDWSTVFIIDIPSDAKSPFIVKADLIANIH